MEKIRVMYFDGQSSKGNNAAVLLMDDLWTIEYLDKDFNTQLISWDVNKIQRYQSSNKIIRFKYGEFPQQVIECSADIYNSLSRNYPQIKNIDSEVSWILTKGTKIILGVTLLFIGLLTSFYFFILPPLAVLIAGQIPLKYEIQLGNSIYESSIKNTEIDDSLTYWVNDFTKHINFKTEYPIQITVIKEDQINAYAVPGGQIVVYDRIIQEMENKEELAALLAHEVSHIHYKHSLKSISRSLSGYIFMSFILSDVSGITAVLVENSHAIMNLNYSRSLEEEADKKGLEILKSNGISQYGFVNLFERMKKEQKGEQLTQILSSHPLINDRISYTQNAAKQQEHVVENEKLDQSWENIKRLAGSPEE